MSDNMTKRAKEYMNADFVYEDYKNLAEAQKIADVEDVTAISERLIKQNMEAYKAVSYTHLVEASEISFRRC